MTFKATFIGLATIDNQFYLDEYPKQNTKNKSKKYAIATGGPATNASIAFSVLGGKSTLITVLGENHFSDFIKEDLNDQGIQIVDILEGKPNSPTIATIITSKNGHRTVFSHAPENNYHLYQTSNKMADSGIFMVDGFYLNLAMEIIQKSKVPKTVIFDGGSWKPGIEDFLPLVDIAICSDDFIPPGCETKDEVIRFLYRSGIQKIAITRGEFPIIYYTGEKKNSLNVPRVKTVDTLGAGDFFHGAFTYFYAQSNNFVHALKEASMFASETCKYFGTRSWIKEILPYT